MFHARPMVHARRPLFALVRPPGPAGALMPSRRERSLLSFVIFPTIFLVTLLLPARVAADGMFVWKNRNVDILEPDQSALIFFDRGREDLVLSVKYAGAPEEFGWIVPVPSVPEMFPEDSLLFDVLSRSTQLRQVEHAPRGERSLIHLGADVVASTRVGTYAAQVLQASAGKDLASWLTENGYELPSGADRVLERYVNDGWLFATLKIAPDAVESLTTTHVRSGFTPPVRFRFATPEPIFPLQISSLMTGPSEILLYVLSRSIGVPKTPKPESWINQINSRPGEQHWIYQYEQDVGGLKFLPDYQEPFFLTKHRVRLDPGEMTDVRFGPYDPASALRSSSEAERLEAIAFLGRMKPDGAFALLADRLEAAPARAESLSIFWALGEIGGAEAERVLLPRVKVADPEIRIEVFTALQRMRSHAALPLCIRELESGADDIGPGTDVWSDLRMVCFRSLIAFGDSSCLGELHRMADRHHGIDSWEKIVLSPDEPRELWDGLEGSEADAGLLAFAALAACGDGAARDTILRDVVTQGRQVTAPEALTSRPSPGVVGLPDAYWIADAIRTGSKDFRDWRALRWLCSLFQASPDFRAALLREAAADPELPRSGAILALANLDTLRVGDVDRLMDLWKESTRKPRYATRAAKGPLWERNARCNYDACAVVHALGQQRRLDELETLWSTLPEGDPVLEAELVTAMADTRDPRFRGIVVDYVRHVWGAAARSKEFERTVAGHVMAVDQLMDAGFDLTHRVRTIQLYLLGYPPDVDFERTLLVNRDDPPYLRLALMSRMYFIAEPRGDLLPVAQAELHRLRKELKGKRGSASAVADNLQRWFDSSAHELEQRKARRRAGPAFP